MWVAVSAVVWVNSVGLLSVVKRPSRDGCGRDGRVGFGFLRWCMCSVVEVGSVDLFSVGDVVGMSAAVIGVSFVVQRRT